MHDLFPAATHASGASTPTTIKLLLLGPVQSTRNGAPLAFPYDKVRALLIYLAVEAHQAHRRSALAGLLWPDQPEWAARHSLTQALWNLRRVLGDEGASSLLRATRDSVEFTPNDAFSLDVAEFTARLAGGDTAQLERAVALYRSDFLQGLALGVGAPFRVEPVAHRPRDAAQPRCALDDHAQRRGASPQPAGGLRPVVAQARRRRAFDLRAAIGVLRWLRRRRSTGGGRGVVCHPGRPGRALAASPGTR